MDTPGDPTGSHALKHLQHPRFARAYARAVGQMNRRGATENRRRMLAGLHGTVIEIGAGDGSAFALYPTAVTHVLALEPDDYLRGLAVERAATAAVPVTVRPAAAERIPADDGSVDAVVASLVLCSVADQAAALAEIRRVLRPGGTLAYYEHVRSERPVSTAALRFGGSGQVFLEQRAVFDGGRLVELPARRREFEVQRTAVVGAGLAGQQPGLLQPVHHLGDGALAHGGPLAEFLHPAR
ncbi:class I SAM-dependent methyltransferase [Arthrobacter globiformis]|uniref:class I SAM-dependent methyltransferase n=1 Tax=Arthrobacter globiformis TaxID=1665 RepID=UPI002788121A|nr:class I SAM-dependent methyltransferase [Arthrobacter globiformis]MDQ0866548.1 SAM-dependent methyltransferase [Arthrobacter globiformis]